jgi:hypothetical protein
MSAGDVFTEIVSPTFVADAGARPCISFTGGAWPAGASWDAFALDDVHLEVVSYPVPTAEVLPQVTSSGSVAEGQTLTHVPATWSIRAPYPLTRTAEFQRCNAMGGACEAIGSGPVGSKHLLSATDTGRTIRVLETAVNDEGEAQSVLSAPTAVVQALPKPEPAEPPVVRPGAGNTLTIDVRWPQGATLGYQWFRCEADRTGCAPIAGATGPDYALNASDAGKYVFVRMTATTSGGATTIDSGYTVPSLSGAFPPIAIGPVGPVPGAPVPPSSPTLGRRVTLSASVNRVRAVVGAPVVVSGTLTGVPIGSRVSVTLANAQWKRHARRYTVHTRSGGRFRATVRPVVSAQVQVAFAGTSAHPATTVATRRIHVTPSIRVRITASPDGPGQVRNLRIRGRFSPGFGQGARLQLEGRPAGGRTWYSFCTRVTVGRGGAITGACNVGRLHATNRYRLVYVAQAGSPWTTAASTPTRARITR